MNAQEKHWVNKWLHQIWIIDNENDHQADDISEFLSELARKTGFNLFKYGEKDES